MKNQFLSIILLFMSVAGYAQSCPDSAVFKKGGWINSADGGGKGGPLTAKYKTQIIPIIDSFSIILRNAYPVPMGSQGRWNRNFWLDNFSKNNSATYQLAADFKGYSCKQEKDLNKEIIVMTESATLMFIQANGVWTTGNFETPQNFLSSESNEGLYVIPPNLVVRTPQKEFPQRKMIDASLPDNIKAFPNFTFEGEYNEWDVSYKTRVVMQMVFITPDNKLPYDALTIGEFLTVNENRLKKYIDDSERNGNSPVNEKMLLERVPVLRVKYADILEEVAYISNAKWNVNTLSEHDVFVLPKNGYMVCRRSSKYFPDKENYKPSFITVIWRWQPEIPYSVKVHEGIKNNFDFNALKQMLVN